MSPTVLFYKSTLTGTLLLSQTVPTALHVLVVTLVEGVEAGAAAVVAAVLQPAVLVTAQRFVAVGEQHVQGVRVVNVAFNSTIYN